MRLAFGCEARVGKSTIVSHLISKYGGVELSFAAPLYEILHYAQEKCKFPRGKDRKFLQWVGTNWAREINPDIWVKLLDQRLESLPPGTNVYISDLRFPNEFEWCKRNGFHVIRIIRENTKKEGLSSEGTFTQGGDTKHASEVSLTSVRLDEWDYVCYNNTNSIENFYSNIESYITSNSE